MFKLPACIGTAGKTFLDLLSDLRLQDRVSAERRHGLQGAGGAGGGVRARLRQRLPSALPEALHLRGTNLCYIDSQDPDASETRVTLRRQPSINVRVWGSLPSP